MEKLEQTRWIVPSWPGINVALMSAWLLRATLYTFVGVALLDPADQMFHLKSPLFVLLCGIWLVRVCSGYTANCRLSLWTGVTLFALVIPLAATLVGMLSGGNPADGTGFTILKSSLMLFLLPVVVSEQIDLVSIIIRESLLIALITISFVLISFLWPLVFAVIYDFTIAKQIALISTGRDQFGIGIGSFYYKTTAILILPLGYYVERFLDCDSGRARNLLLTLIYFCALVFSGARANALAGLGVIGIFALRKVRKSLGWNAAVSAFLVVTFLAASFYFPRFFDPAEESNAVKLGHVSSYLYEFERHPQYLIWGEGADTEFYSAGFGQRTTITELTYLELVRNFGLPVTLLFLTLLLWPLVWLLGSRARSSGAWYLAFPYLAYIVTAGSNPLLVSSTGLLVVVAVWRVSLALKAQEGHLTGDMEVRNEF